MDILGTAPGGSDTLDLIKDVNEATFMQDVVEVSKEVPVIVDFWAPWCGPCKTLGPALEEAVRAARGKVRMVKINVDENQNIAGQMRVQSIPAVFAFVDGQPIDGFMGALAGSEIKAFVDKIVAASGGNAGMEEALEAAQQMLDEGAVTDAAQTFAAILGEEPENPEALAGMVRCYLALDDLDNARAFTGQIPENLISQQPVASAIAELDLREASQDAGDVAPLRAAVEANADDHQSRLDLALALSASGDNEGAIGELLELFRRDREWNEAAAKEQLIKIFDMLGPKDPVAQKGRRALTSMVFL